MFNHQYLPHQELNLLRQAYKKAALSHQQDNMQKIFEHIDKICSSIPDSSQKLAIYDELIYHATNTNMNPIVHLILKTHPAIKLSKSTLNAAAESGNLDVLYLCLEKYLIPDQFTLFRAIYGNHQEVIVLLLDKYPLLFLDQSMLFTALSLGNIAFVDWLLEAGKQVFSVDLSIVNAAKQLAWSPNFNSKLVTHLETIFDASILSSVQSLYHANHPN
ncbi:MAG: hypothetical protein WAW86_09115 [Gammaproteobacteria bacterium]